MINVEVVDLTKAPFEHGQEIPTEKFQFEVRHTRNYSKSKLDQCGGHTHLFCLNNKRVYTAKCKYTDKFHKRAGVLMALQRFIGKGQIIDFSFKKDCIVIYIDKRGSPDHWFLTANYQSHSSSVFKDETIPS